MISRLMNTWQYDLILLMTSCILFGVCLPLGNTWGLVGFGVSIFSSAICIIVDIKGGAYAKD